MNRAVRSATHEAMGDGQGGITPDALNLYGRLSSGELGTIITGIMYVCQEGKPGRLALGIDRDELVPGLRELASTIRASGSRAIFQLVHAGPQTSRDYTGSVPLAPSSDRRDPVTRKWPEALPASRVPEIAAQFAQAARRAREAGADGVQVHAAHGYLLSSFLSPFWNTRQDEYGGSDEARYRPVGEVIKAVRDAVGNDFPVWAKMNVEEMTPEPGMTPERAAYYAKRMWEDGIECLEVSAGSSYWTPFVMARGEVPAKEIARTAPWPLRPLVARGLRRLPAPAFEEAYNLPGAKRIRQEVPDLPLAVVGGMRSRAAMEECLGAGATHLISLCRPLIREPHLIRRFHQGQAETSSCISCSRCFAAIVNEMPVACYADGLPRKD
ncbi:MAG: NADH:flavin oxidoreductase [Thermoleophilia bacterium]|nr:NADH:flavin oxidoreductase [Thermoleophilia bacterium]